MERNTISWIIFYCRQTEDGQLEAIPGTIEVQVDDIIEKHLSEQETGIQQAEDGENYPKIKHEQSFDETQENLEHSSEDNVIEENSEHMESETYDENSFEQQDDKEDETLEEPDFVMIKQEMIENTNSNNDSLSDVDEDYGTPEYLLSENEQDDEPTIDNDTEIETETIRDIMPAEETEDIVKVEQLEEPKRKFFKAKEQIIRNKIAVYPGNRKISYLLLNSVEKENVENNITSSSIKNSRSLLKNTVLSAIEGKEVQDALNNIMQDNKNKRSSIRIINSSKSFNKDNANDSLSESVNVEKKNEIAEKSVRQPRKQTITPIERNDSEIIVQPVFYSFNDHEPLLLPIKRKNQIEDEIVKVSDDSESDSDDEPLGKFYKFFFKLLIYLLEERVIALVQSNLNDL